MQYGLSSACKCQCRPAAIGHHIPYRWDSLLVEFKRKIPTIWVKPCGFRQGTIYGCNIRRCRMAEDDRGIHRFPQFIADKSRRLEQSPIQLRDLGAAVLINDRWRNDGIN